ncbi:MAG: glycosyltransferase family 39 protein [Candidatus Chisholmbacteria bacterium]|nr:glycosyltransferase family 39 protein [Candidatus Chisholmbacteria bacterium]
MYKKLAVIVIVIGIGLRIREYLLARTFSFDEAAVAISLMDKSWSDMGNLYYHMHRPYGFLLVVKSIISVLGNHELAFRLVPLVAGIAGVFLFYKLAVRLLHHQVALLALGLFAVSPRVVGYSAVLREYSLDILINLLIFLLLTHYLAKEKITAKEVLVLGLGGAIFIWVSNPALFTLLFVGITAPVYLLSTRKKALLVQFGGVALLWLVSAVVNYFVVIKPAAADAQFLVDLSVDFPPMPHQFLSSSRWFGERFLSEVLYYQVGTTYFPALILLLVGGYSFWQRNRWVFFCLVAPLMLVWLLAYFDRFPVTGRHLLFTAPAVMLFVASGVGRGFRWAQRHTYKTIAVAIMAGWLVVGVGAYYVDFQIRFGEEQENIKQMLVFLREQMQEGDWIYVYNSTVAPYKYYAPRYVLKELPYIEGSYRTTVSFSNYTQDIQILRGKSRVWAIFTHNYDWGLIDEQAFIVSYFDSIGQRLSFYPYGTSALYLYDLSEKVR